MLDLAQADPALPVTVYLPEGMKPEIVSLRATQGELRPAPKQPRWICYGDSIAEGWSASEPALSWPPWPAGPTAWTWSTSATPARPAARSCRPSRSPRWTRRPSSR
ncbi:hypothetical protein ACFQ9X_03155 [Catenulispora yoronensis]